MMKNNGEDCQIMLKWMSGGGGKGDGRWRGQSAGKGDGGEIEVWLVILTIENNMD